MEKLNVVVDFLNSKNINISEKHEDGRINSIDDEATIIEILKKEYGNNIIEPPPRCWWDLKIFGVPINIKVSAFKTADNFSAKGAVLFSLTNLSEKEIDSVKSWKAFEDKVVLGKDIEDNGRDYYCIVLNKTTNEVMLQGLKTLTKLTPNGNNLLFQINWSKNKTIINRTHKESYDFLIGAYKESVRKKVSVHDGYETL